MNEGTVSQERPYEENQLVRGPERPIGTNEYRWDLNACIEAPPPSPKRQQPFIMMMDFVPQVYMHYPQ